MGKEEGKVGGSGKREGGRERGEEWGGEVDWSKEEAKWGRSDRVRRKRRR